MAVTKKKRAPAAKAKKAPVKAVKAKVAKPAKKPAAVKAAVVKEPLTKSQMFTDISEFAGVSKKEVSAVFEGISRLVAASISKKGPGKIKIPGLMQIEIKERPATKARKGINPFTGEEIMIKAKPKRRAVKIRALKSLKEMAEA